MQIEGVVSPLITPVESRNGKIDTETLRLYVKFLEERGIDGLFPCGTTGEFASLTCNERKTVLKTVVNSTSLPVYAGCGDTSIRGVLTQIRTAEDIGADVAVVVTPYYFTTSQNGLQQFYKRIADRSSLPIILYDIPSYTNQPLSVATITKLSEHDNIIGIKDSSRNLYKLNQYLLTTPDSFSVLQGSTIYALASLDMGVDGFVSGEANLIPGPLSSVYAAYGEGDRNRATSLMQKFEFPITALLSETSSATSDIPAIKYLLRNHGFEMGPPLPPLPELSERQRDDLNAATRLFK